MYREGKEALFWKDEEECAEMCTFALENETRRKTIAASGHARLIANRHYNERVLEDVLNYVQTTDAS
jgi:spore maturation protein CgeB